jgi:hypothetical protein
MQTPIAAWQSNLLDRVMTRERLYVHDPGRRRGRVANLGVEPGAYTYASLKDEEVFPRVTKAMIELDKEYVKMASARVTSALEDQLRATVLGSTGA